MSTTVDVRTVRSTSAADHADAVAALSAGFFDDPVFRWVYPDDDRRRAVLPRFFGVFTTAIGRHGASLVAGEGAGVGAAPGSRPAKRS